MPTIVNPELWDRFQDPLRVLKQGELYELRVFPIYRGHNGPAFWVKCAQSVSL
jgi:hypothetical protein